jgi:Rrf2 family protein
MRLTKESEYALLGMAHLASQPSGSLISLSRIAEVERLPRTFLSKIFRKLARHQLLISGRGRGRGYALARSAEQIAIREILEAVEGPSMLRQCLLWSGECSDEDPCPLHDWLKDVWPTLGAMLEEVTLADYVSDSGHFRAHTAQLEAS